MSAPGARQPQYAFVADALRAQILAGELQPGDRLPVEPELSARYGVSRSTVREALRVLSSQHLVDHHARGVRRAPSSCTPTSSRSPATSRSASGCSRPAPTCRCSSCSRCATCVEVPAAGLAAERRDRRAPRGRARHARRPARRRAGPDARVQPPVPPGCSSRPRATRCSAWSPTPVFGVLTTRFVRGDASASFWDTVSRRPPRDPAAGSRPATRPAPEPRCTSTCPAAGALRAHRPRRHRRRADLSVLTERRARAGRRLEGSGRGPGGAPSGTLDRTVEQSLRSAISPMFRCGERRPAGRGVTPMTVHPAQLGRFFDDYEVGDVYQHPFGRTISEADSPGSRC